MRYQWQRQFYQLVKTAFTELKPALAKVTQENKNNVPEIQEAQGWIYYK